MGAASGLFRLSYSFLNVQKAHCHIHQSFVLADEDYDNDYYNEDDYNDNKDNDLKMSPVLLEFDAVHGLTNISHMDFRECSEFNFGGILKNAVHTDFKLVFNVQIYGLHGWFNTYF